MNDFTMPIGLFFGGSVNFHSGGNRIEERLKSQFKRSDTFCRDFPCFQFLYRGPDYRELVGLVLNEMIRLVSGKDT